jgi:stearoyl-CoA desaturase (delta-9 desaturase)
VQFGASFVVWGVFLRTATVWHVTWSVNSLSHIWGYQNYETGDHSRNNWLVSVVAVGEGWHNNHHADPRSASHGHRWWEWDATYWVIRILKFGGLAWNVVLPRATTKS